MFTQEKISIIIHRDVYMCYIRLCCSEIILYNSEIWTKWMGSLFSYL